MPSLFLLSFSFFFFFSVIVFEAQSLVPENETFQFVNNGVIGHKNEEYNAYYRFTGLFNRPFYLCFYNTTSNDFTLALGMGTQREDTFMAWVWEANRGNPVGENGTLTFGTDGNLVLADADGRIAWQTNTANKGVVGFQIFPNGNMVLHDKKGKFMWQSYDFPTDTLLVGQSLKLGATTKLVSRASEKTNANGPYSLVMENMTLSMYYKAQNSPNPLRYFSFFDFVNVLKIDAPLQYVTFQPDLSLTHEGANPSSKGKIYFDRIISNLTYAYLRLEIDGNLRVHTYEHDGEWRPWHVIYTLFSRDSFWWGVSECQLPERCGNFGLCEDNQCVACPSSKGLKGWSKDCEPDNVASCEVKDFRYYKLQDVDHFITKYTEGDGPMKLGACRDKCNTDCKCLGYFYHPDFSKCWIAYNLKTLSKVANSTYLAYIKAPS